MSMFYLFLYHLKYFALIISFFGVIFSLKYIRIRFTDEFHKYDNRYGMIK